MPNLLNTPDETIEKVSQVVIALYTKLIDEKEWVHFIESNEKEKL